MTNQLDLRELVFSLLSPNDFKFLSLVNRESRQTLLKLRKVPTRFRCEKFETVSTIEFAFEHGVKKDGRLLDEAARVGNVALLNYVHVHLRVPLSRIVGLISAYLGQVSVFQWLIEQEYQFASKDGLLTYRAWYSG